VVKNLSAGRSLNTDKVCNQLSGDNMHTISDKLSWAEKEFKEFWQHIVIRVSAAMHPKQGRPTRLRQQWFTYASSDFHGDVALSDKTG
jgi:hypothetical protein